jgi:hypothetical protein
MHALIALQVAFCFLVLFIASLFVATFERLSHRATGFSAERLLTLDTVAERPQPPAFWDQIADHLRTVPGVEKVAMAGWPLLVGYSFRSYISISGVPQNGVFTYFLSVSPGWIDAMKIAFVDGRDFLASDTSLGVAIVNEAFAKAYFDGENPVENPSTKGTVVSGSWAWFATPGIAACASPSCRQSISRFNRLTSAGHGHGRPWRHGAEARSLYAPTAPTRSRSPRLCVRKYRGRGPSSA